MKNKIVAYCNNINELNIITVKDPEKLKHFPGAFWLYELSKMLDSIGVLFVTGDIALTNVINKKWNAKDIIIIQEIDSFHGYKLVKLGSTPFVITCLESPLYAYKFYDKLSLYANKFPIRIMFKGIFNDKKLVKGENFNLLFPNFYNQFEEMISWNERSDIVLVASNKNTKLNITIPRFEKKRHFFYWIMDVIYKIKSKSRRSAIKKELLTKRTSLINILGDYFKIDIYGNGWDKLKLSAENNNLIRIFGKCIDKNNTLSKYKFCICFENVEYEGYITEKMIDCFASRTIPIYFGAPDVKSFIPESSFIDVRDFPSTKELVNYLNNFDEKKFNEMLKCGENFLLNNPEYSHKGFAKKIFQKFLIFKN